MKKKKKKGVFWGIEVAETLRWRGWELGKEMIKHLVLKNVHEKTQKLSYRCPSTRFFCTVFPQPITLSPGMSLSLPIVFRPTEKRDYEDSICFKKAEGEFSVTLHAMLPRLRLSFPAAVQLPICAVHNTTETLFPVRNVGNDLGGSGVADAQADLFDVQACNTEVEESLRCLLMELPKTVAIII
ncbi:cilia- and flagella-associated protein 65-like [Melanerpes formicivorus]|uniref:cilia- and flagella-associated protein 65-like n=1 Tax=Melanerpes formicivorus TaxID=211600 RepID=UPI00358DFC41